VPERHLPFFLALDAHPAALARVCERHQFTGIATGAELFVRCQSEHLDHARTVLPLVRETDEVGLKAIECLVGKPVQPWCPPSATPSRGVVAKSGERKLVPQASGDRDRLYVVAIVPNPKKVGSASHTRFALWQVGLTVAECMARGISRGDVSWDVERGFVTLGESPTPAGE
jgi:hypothetical protein